MGQKREGTAANIPTLNFAKNAKFRMGHPAALSLKRYRRAELEDELHHKSLIRNLYVDPLPGEHIFKTVLKPKCSQKFGPRRKVPSN